MNYTFLPKFSLPRVYLPTETLGSIYDDSITDPEKAIICKTMELPWLNNKNNVSCIPEDLYIVTKMKPSFGRDYGYFRFAYVIGRTMNPGANMSSILMHRITYVKDLAGCVGVGGRHADLNKDGIPDMADSGKKLQWMYENMPDVFLLDIKKKV